MRNWTLEDNGNDNLIDPRDIGQRINELESERGNFEGTIEDLEEGRVTAVNTGTADEVIALNEEIAEARAALEEWDNSDEARELKTLKDFWDDIDQNESLIADSYFEEYAQELAEELGYMDSANRWPYTCIDWEQAARGLQQDYSLVTLADSEYWQRSEDRPFYGQKILLDKKNGFVL